MYARAYRHLQLLLRASAAKDLAELPPGDVKDLFLLDALSWSETDDSILSQLNGNDPATVAAYNALCAQRGQAEVNAREQFQLDGNEECADANESDEERSRSQ